MHFFIPIAYAQGAAEQSAAGFGDFLGVILGKIPFIIAAFGIMIVSLIIGKIAKRAAQRAILRTGRHEGALSIVGKSVYVGCIVLGLTIALKIAGIDVSFIVGAASFGLGFAMKSVLENYIAGVIILVQEPFRIGDMIQMKEYFGRVETIEARTTFIRLFDGQRIVIPNSDMISNSVINYSVFPQRRITLEFGVSYDSILNAQRIIDIAFTAMKQDSRILQDPPPMVNFNGYGPSVINVVVRFWIDNTVSNWLEMQSVGTQIIGKAFTENGIVMPYPVTTLSINKDDSDDLYEYLQHEKAVSKMRIEGVHAEPSKN